VICEFCYIFFTENALRQRALCIGCSCFLGGNFVSTPSYLYAEIKKT